MSSHTSLKKIDQKEYLKKYLSGDKEKKKKKKDKKHKKKATVKIIDDDACADNDDELDEDLLLGGEDAPQIVGEYVLERPNGADKWKSIAVKDEPEDQVKQEPSIDENDLWGRKANANIKLENSTPPRRNRRDTSPPIINIKKEPNSPRPAIKQESHSPSRDAEIPRHKSNGKRRSLDQSPPRKRHNDKYSDQSPPRKSAHSHNRDQSPPRRNQRGRSSDQSPPRKSAHSHKRDQSPPRRKQSGKSSDQSPPRRSARSHSKDQSPPRRKQRGPSSDRARGQSPTSRRRVSSDQSPPRRRPIEQSPSRRRRSRDKSPNRRPHRKPPADQSPPRRRERSRSPQRQQRERRHSEDQSPARRTRREHNSPSPRPRKSRWAKPEPVHSPSPPPTHAKHAKTLDGKKAGLQDAKSLQVETQERRHREDRMFDQMSRDVSGRDADVQVRNTGRRGQRGRDAAAEDPEVARRKEEHEKKKKELYDRWGKGLKQVEQLQERHAEMMHEANKPVARYANDEDLDKHLREQEHADDPMLEYIRQKRKEREKDTGMPTKPLYQGSYPENRFGIRPGYRWDGVDRSNGYEQKWFDVRNEKRARQDEAYKFSVEDM